MNVSTQIVEMNESRMEREKIKEKLNMMDGQNQVSSVAAKLPWKTPIGVYTHFINKNISIDIRHMS